MTQKGKSNPLDIGGTVTWSSNTGCSPSTVTGDPGTAQCTTTTLPQGTDTITATYGGDTNHSGSTGTLAGGQVVNPVITSTSINVTSVSPSSEVYGLDSTVTITAVLSWTGSGPEPTASDISIGGNGPSGYSATTCGSPVSDTLTCTATYTPTASDIVGTYTELATFSGDSNYSGSSSPQTNNFSITQATSTTSVASSQNPSTVGQSVTFTATIDGEYGLIVKRNGVALGGLTRKGLAPERTGAPADRRRHNRHGDLEFEHGMQPEYSDGRSRNVAVHHHDSAPGNRHNNGNLLGRQQPQRKYGNVERRPGGERSS